MGGILLLNVSLADMEVQLHEDRKRACQHCPPNRVADLTNKRINEEVVNKPALGFKRCVFFIVF